MKKLDSKLVSLANEFASDYHKKMVLGNMIRNADFLIDANHRQHSAKVAEITSVIENYDEDRDAARVERLGEYIDMLKSQFKDLQSYKADLLIAYKTVLDEDYEAPAAKASTKTNRVASKYVKEYAAQ